MSIDNRYIFYIFLNKNEGVNFVLVTHLYVWEIDCGNFQDPKPIIDPIGRKATSLQNYFLDFPDQNLSKK